MGKVLLEHWLREPGMAWVSAVRVLTAVALSSSLENVSVLTVMANLRKGAKTDAILTVAKSRATH